MSKTRSLQLFTSVLPCTTENVVELLEKAGWSVFDSNGRIHIWNTETDEWERFNGLFERFLSLERCCFRAFGNGVSINVFVSGGNCFDITLEPKYTAVDGELVFDFNWYYNRLVERMNSNRCVIERVVFDEY